MFQSPEAEAEPWSPLRGRITVLCPPCAPWHMHHHTHPPYTSVKENNDKITFKKVSQWFYSSDIKLFQHILIINIQEHINRIRDQKKKKKSHNHLIQKKASKNSIALMIKKNP